MSPPTLGFYIADKGVGGGRRRGSARQLHNSADAAADVPNMYGNIHTGSGMSHPGSSSSRPDAAGEGEGGRGRGGVAMATHLCQFHSASLQTEEAPAQHPCTRRSCLSSAPGFRAVFVFQGGGASARCVFLCVCLACAHCGMRDGEHAALH